MLSRRRGSARLAAGALALVLAVAAGCGGKVVFDGEGQGGASGATTGTGTGAGTPCGDAVCGAGEYCCNESCDQCATEGDACATIACL